MSGSNENWTNTFDSISWQPMHPAGMQEAGNVGVSGLPPFDMNSIPPSPALLMSQPAVKLLPTDQALGQHQDAAVPMENAGLKAKVAELQGELATTKRASKTETSNLKSRLKESMNAKKKAEQEVHDTASRINKVSRGVGFGCWVTILYECCSLISSLLSCV